MPISSTKARQGESDGGKNPREHGRALFQDGQQEGLSAQQSRNRSRAEPVRLAEDAADSDRACRERKWSAEGGDYPGSGDGGVTQHSDCQQGKSRAAFDRIEALEGPDQRQNDRRETVKRLPGSSSDQRRGGFVPLPQMDEGESECGGDQDRHDRLRLQHGMREKEDLSAKGEWLGDISDLGKTMQTEGEHGRQCDRQDANGACGQIVIEAGRNGQQSRENHKSKGAPVAFVKQRKVAFQQPCGRGEDRGDRACGETSLLRSMDGRRQKRRKLRPARKLRQKSDKCRRVSGVPGKRAWRSARRN